MDINHLREWIGRSESRTDQVTLSPMAAMSATLDRFDPPPKVGDLLPVLWHWLYFLPIIRQNEMGTDGHPMRGGFLPPVPLPRRMWAGGHLQFFNPLRAGDTLTRVSRIVDVKQKEGGTGSLVFALVCHEIRNSTGLALLEEQNIVYRSHDITDDVKPTSRLAREDHSWVQQIDPDEVFLFRYSALTFNGHRIHYDIRYATEVEGYPGLVVHGPLIATLLIDLLRRELPEATVASFSYRAVKPLFNSNPFFVCGRLENEKTVSLWAKRGDGELAMEATATIL